MGTESTPSPRPVNDNKTVQKVVKRYPFLGWGLIVILLAVGIYYMFKGLP